MDDNLIEKVRNFVKNIFQEKYDTRSTYHSYEHTREVAEAAAKIGNASGLSKEELEAVVIAAWFHDTGYLVGTHDHETESAKLATSFLRENNYPEEKINRVTECIMATHMQHVPSNLMEEVIHDADYINLANPDNLKQSQMLRDELVNYGGEKPTDEEWLSAELRFLLNHRYYTSYARNKLEDKKEENIKKIKKKLKKWRENEKFLTPFEVSRNGEKNHGEVAQSAKEFKGNIITEELSEVEKNSNNSQLIADNKMTVTNNDTFSTAQNTADEKDKKNSKEEKKEDKDKKDDKKEDKEKKDEKKEKSDKEKKELEERKEKEKREAQSVKEFDTIYKLIATNHMRLNEIADRKANIMLTLNGIIISITLSVLASASDANPRLIIPSGIMVLVCLLTIIFAALSTRPNITKGNVAKEDIVDKKANLLFFGNFSRMDFQDFDWGIRQVITDQEYLHNSMIIDFYNLGKVLDVKYRYLRICYNIFMFGIILAVISIAFVIAMGY